ncbi:MAG: vitamin K epoxide reductase family protein [Anaerolineales bacterium]|nr:vitamin K epoxide reductase family protein [Anaerolineales bacterium]
MKLVQNFIRISLFITVLSLSFVQPAQAQGDLPVVRAVMFFSPTCGHCHKVITEDLPPLFETYGDQLQIIGMDTSTAQGQELFMAAVQVFQVPAERTAVPLLVIGDTVLVGSFEIPSELPGIIADGLANGGIAWPDIPGMDEVVASLGLQDENAAAEPAEEAAVEPIRENESQTDAGMSGMEAVFVGEMSVSERFMLDPLANGISVVVLLAMLGSATYILLQYNERDRRLPRWPAWIIPALVAVGLVAAIYLAFVEVTDTQAVCGPVGDCNAVQQSKYATLFGFLPVGVLGLIGYVLILAAWGFWQYSDKKISRNAIQFLWVMAAFGLLFSIYLTFLEPFVIGATCAWCLTSAVVMTLIFWAASEPAMAAYKRKKH